MTTEFAAIMNHSLELAEILSLDRTLTAESREILPQLWDASRGVERWTTECDAGASSLREQLEAERHICIAGPFRMTVYVNHEMASLSDATSWFMFLSDQQRRRALLATVHWLARCLRATTIVYTANSDLPASGAYELIWEGASLNDVNDYLQESCGPAAGSRILRRSDLQNDRLMIGADRNPIWDEGREDSYYYELII